MKNPFPNLIGQTALKNRLSFALQAHEVGKMIPHYLFVGAFGCGKTLFIREFCKKVKGDDGKIRKFIEVNSSTIKNLTQFVEKIVMPHVHDRSVNLLLDEAHALPNDVVMFMLSLLNTERSPVRSVPYGDSNLEMDFLRQSIHMATTEPDKIFKPLKSRMEIMAMAPYSNEELQEIIRINAPDVEFKENVLVEVSSSVKGTGRSCVAMAKKIEDFCAIKGRKSFDQSDFRNLAKMADIKSYGLDSVEVSILRLLNERGPLSLNELSATLNLSRSALMHDHEHHLMNKNFLRVNGRREITQKGKEVLKQVK